MKTREFKTKFLSVTKDKVLYKGKPFIFNFGCRDIGLDDNFIIGPLPESTLRYIQNISHELSLLCSHTEIKRDRSFINLKGSRDALERFNFIKGCSGYKQMQIDFDQLFEMRVSSIETENDLVFDRIIQENMNLKEELGKAKEEIKMLKAQVDFQPDPPGAGYLKAKEEFENLKEK